jgi:hypothetical protein
MSYFKKASAKAMLATILSTGLLFLFVSGVFYLFKTFTGVMFGITFIGLMLWSINNIYNMFLTSYKEQEIQTETYIEEEEE